MRDMPTRNTKWPMYRAKLMAVDNHWHLRSPVRHRQKRRYNFIKTGHWLM